MSAEFNCGSPDPSASTEQVLWAEPVTALSTFAALIVLLIAIGLGSTLFHILATTRAGLLAVVPIVLAFIRLYSRSGAQVLLDPARKAAAAKP